MPITPHRPPWLPPIATPAETDFAAIERAAHDASPERLFKVADASLSSARTLLQTFGPEGDAGAFGGNLAWAYVALRRLLFAKAAHPATRPSGEIDIMQATRDIARGA